MSTDVQEGALEGVSLCEALLRGRFGLLLRRLRGSHVHPPGYLLQHFFVHERVVAL